METQRSMPFSIQAGLVVAVLGLACALPSPAGAEPCNGGVDVRLLDDSSVPDWLKNQIFDPGPIINIKHPQYPSGNVVVIRAASEDFPSNPAATAAYVDEIFYGSNEIPGMHMRGYFSRNSWGMFQVAKGATPKWINVKKPLSAYSPGVEGNSTYLQDVLELADVDWAALDTDQNGTISIAEAQIVILIPNALPNTGFASVRGVKAGNVATPQGTFTFPERPIVTFSLKAVADPKYADNPIRVLAAMAHELAHAFFGLPDRYGANTGSGEYDMMGSGGSNKWVHLPMTDKVKIGWIQPKILRHHERKCMQFVASALQAAALIIVPIDQFLGNPLEYWVIENRNKEYDEDGYDSDLPDTGLAVWYVSTGTKPGGHDDVRLVNFSQTDQDPDLYNNPWTNALFKLDPDNFRRIIIDRNGHWNLLYFQDVSDINAGWSGLFMYAEF
jgi:M6 family metalloprotease-like protein